MANEHYFSYKKATLCYSKIGNGQEIVLAFPGFGQSRRIYNPPGNNPDPEITLYAFDLFFNGKSEWGYGENPVTKEFWNELLESFLQDQRIERFSAVGFSLGARFALATFEAFGSKINQLFLIAPDGLHVNKWYTLATSTFLTRKLFKHMIEKPGWFFSMTNLLGRLHMLNPRLLRFAEHQMRSREMRTKIYSSWIVFRRLSIRKKEFHKVVKQHPDAITIVLGQRDTIIPPESIMEVLGKASSVKVFILETGHTALISSFMEGHFLMPNRKPD